MNPRTALVVAALLLWGWQTKLFWPAAAMAAVFGGSTWVRARVAFGPREWARLWDVTLLLLAGTALYQRQTSSVSGAVLSFLQWLPMLLFPFTASVLFSSSPRVADSTFIFWWRRKPHRRSRSIDPLYPYFAICLLAASAGGTRDSWFYPVSTLLIFSALWLNRPRRLRPAATLLLLAIAGAAGLFLQTRWRDFQGELETRTLQWLTGFFPRPFEDQEAHTSLGEIGRLKSSARVLMRLHTERGSPPHLLRQVSFDQYRRGVWLSTRRSYSPASEISSGLWKLADSRTTNVVRIRATVPEGRILLPLPTGASHVDRLPAARLEHNRFGNVRVWDCPDPLECSIQFDGAVSHEAPPGPRDLQVPLADEPAAEEIVRQLDLRSMSPAAATVRLGEYFSKRFRYALVSGESELNLTNSASYVSSFLLETRRGHCEYFATAAALVLRKAEIPTRYAMGFAAVESAGDRDYRIRERHAHSWVLAYIDGHWRDFDPTPATWHASESEAASLVQRVADVSSELKFTFATMRWLPNLDARLAWLTLVPLVAVAWAVFKRRKRFKLNHIHCSLREAFAWPGLDSELFQVEQSLRARGFTRQPDETHAAWIARLPPQCRDLEMLNAALVLHYRYRFDPIGISVEQREQLATNVRQWLARQEKR
jgi:protein-glutamine gamma-glutamyltransferase